MKTNIRISLRIEGMHCQSCVQRVRENLSSVRGVEIVEVKIGSAQIAYDENQTNQFLIVTAIEKIGYRVLNEKEGGTQP